jgi:hypothetical protein
MSIEIKPISEGDLPFGQEGVEIESETSIAIQSKLDGGAVADGETAPFNWMDLRHVPENFSRLLNASEAVLEAPEATLALTYPLEIAATRSIRPADGKAFTRGELVRLIDETYREVYRLETDSQSSPTPAVHERGQLINRPGSDGTFGIWGHDLDDLGIAEIKVYRIDGRVWLDPDMVS